MENFGKNLKVVGVDTPQETIEENQTVFNLLVNEVKTKNVGTLRFLLGLESRFEKTQQYILMLKDMLNELEKEAKKNEKEIKKIQKVLNDMSAAMQNINKEIMIEKQKADEYQKTIEENELLAQKAIGPRTGEAHLN